MCGTGLSLRSLDGHLTKTHKTKTAARKEIRAVGERLAVNSQPHIKLIDEFDKVVKDRALCQAHAQNHDGDLDVDPDVAPVCCYLGGSDRLPWIPGIRVVQGFLCGAPDCEDHFIAVSAKEVQDHISQKHHSNQIEVGLKQRKDWVRGIRIQTLQNHTHRRRWYEVIPPIDVPDDVAPPVASAQLLKKALELAGSGPKAPLRPVHLVCQLEPKDLPAYVARRQLPQKLDLAGLLSQDSDAKLIELVKVAHGSIPTASNKMWRRPFTVLGGLELKEAGRRAEAFLKDVVIPLRRSADRRSADRDGGDLSDDAPLDTPLCGAVKDFVDMFDKVLTYWQAQDKPLVDKFRGSLDKHVRLDTIQERAAYSDRLCNFLILLLLVNDLGRDGSALYQHLSDSTLDMLGKLRSELRRLTGKGKNAEENMEDDEFELDAEPDVIDTEPRVIEKVCSASTIDVTQLIPPTSMASPSFKGSGT